ncbi:MAG: SLAP domain-containing protein [Lactobacillus sp.]|nr:SLAP domain-containing protein [Lactobacillus sp.]
MKKSSLMGASVVAAALLAAAPIAAPVANIAVSGTQIVKADETDNVAAKVKAMSTDTPLVNQGDGYGTFKDFSSQLGHIVELSDFSDSSNPHIFDSTESDKAPFYVVNNATDGYAIKLSSTMKSKYSNPTNALLKYFFSGANQVNLVTPQNADMAQKMYYTVRFDYSNAISKVSYQLKDEADSFRARHDMELNGGKVTMSLQLFDARKQSLGAAGLMQSSVSLDDTTNKAAYVKYDNALTAKVGDSAEKYGLSNSFMNAGGSILNSTGADITQNVYDAGAIQAGQLRSTNWNDPNFTVDGNFDTQGEYYQHIFIDLNKLGLKGGPEAAYARGDVRVNGQVPSSVNVDANAYYAVAGGTVDGINYPDNTLILKRTVKVGPADLAAKEEKVDGIVTVKNNGQGSAQLYNRSGDPIVDRALATGSNWKTDIKRTVYANGEVYYRVSTDEFVKASDVTFSGNDDSSATTSSIKGDVVVTPLAKRSVLHVESAAGFNTSLWSKADDNKSMNLIADRTLAGDSNWQTDQSATVNGQTFYRVSTNEWINAKYVSVK